VPSAAIANTYGRQENLKSNFDLRRPMGEIPKPSTKTVREFHHFGEARTRPPPPISGAVSAQAPARNAQRLAASEVDNL
jgi:hypothetical protein